METGDAIFWGGICLLALGYLGNLVYRIVFYIMTGTTVSQDKDI